MRKVFLVDDEPLILEGLKNIIDWKAHGLEILGQAVNGMDACRIMEHEPADILITDISMPEMNGLELIKRIKQMNSNTKFIVLSGYNDFDYVKQGILLGIENYLLKPVNTEELVSTIANTLAKIESSVYGDIYKNEDINILRDNILFRWLNNKIDYTELLERSGILKLNISCACYSACIVKVTANEGNPDAVSASNAKLPPYSTVYSRIRSTIKDNAACLCFNNSDGNFLLIFGAESEDAGKSAARRQLEAIHAELADIKNLELFITAGDFQYGCMNLYKSYNHAREMQDYKLVGRCENILFYEDYIVHIQTPSSAFQGPKIDYQLFSKLLLSQNKEEVYNFIDLSFEEIRKQSQIKPSAIQNCCIEMVIHINRTFQNFDLNINLESSYKDLFLSMISLDSIEKLQNFIKDIADNAINCFITSNSRVSPIVQQVLNHINNHYMEELSLKTLGSKLNVNPAYLGQLFQKETGQLFNEYINTFKMEKAKQLLLNTAFTATEISAKTGFTDPNYFFRQFKKYAGISPSEFRTYKQY